MRPTPGPVIAVVLTAALAMTVVATYPRSNDTAKDAGSLDPRTGGRLYAATSTFNQLIPANPQLDPRSTNYVKLLSRSKTEKGFVLSVKEWTVPVYFAQPDTARQRAS
jgi:hypothetical protein